jgi:hypothetical protein
MPTPDLGSPSACTAPPLAAADSGYGDNSQFRAALDERGIVYINGETLAHPAPRRAHLVREVPPFSRRVGYLASPGSCFIVVGCG